ncbi:preprotein translocase subunit YajC [Haloimpatiens sp. FM7330]|uniref:preprotein translocase subunit YajC n=1 Tax=Haloimpatiens sp. FM7330 TaxID=3298610 RepID=UPI00363BCD85
MENIVGFLPLIGAIVVFYLIIFIPENKRKKKFRAMLDNLKVNDEVMTRGGIIGSIVNIKDDYIIMQTGPNNVRIKLSKNGIATILDKNENSEIAK